MANEKGVWRTIGGRRVFIKEGQDLASAMKESGKFKSASKGTAKKEMTKEEKVFEDFKNSDGSKENFEKALNKISEMEYNNEINPDEYKNYISKVQKEYVEKNRKAGEENKSENKLDEKEKKELEYVKKTSSNEAYNRYMNERSKWDPKLNDNIAKLEEDTKDMSAYDKYNLAVSKLEDKDNLSKEEKHFWNRAKMDYEREQKNSDGKKLEAYRINEDGKKEMYERTLGDDERGYWTKENGQRVFKENPNYKGEKSEQFSVSDLKKKAQATLPKEDIDTHEGDLYLKKTKESTELLNNMKDKDSGLLTTFKDQETGETWYDIPFANMGDDYKEKTWRDKIKDPNTRNEILDKELDESTKSKTKEFWNKEDSNDTDLNKFNDKAKAKFGKIDYNGTGRKVNDVEIEMELKDGVFSARGSIKNARGTDSLSGGQNIDEIADLMKDNKDVQEIRDLWSKYHLNDMHAGTEKQEDALMKKFGNRHASDYDKHVEYLKSVGLYEDDGYKYGTGWLKREIPDDDKRRIISLINKYNGKISSSETSNKTTNQTMNETLRNAFNDYRKKHKNSDMSFTEFMKINKK